MVKHYSIFICVEYRSIHFSCLNLKELIQQQAAQEGDCGSVVEQPSPNNGIGGLNLEPTKEGSVSCLRTLWHMTDHYEMTAPPQNSQYSSREEKW